MQEVLSKPDQPTVPLKEQVFYELQIYDPNSYTSDFVVMQSRATWSEVDGQFMFDEIENDLFPTLEAAEVRYSERRCELAKRGFVHSDMDF
ncbi:MAG: hypothetical protein WCA10_17900 [Terracidiphilus sp.]